MNPSPIRRHLVRALALAPLLPLPVLAAPEPWRQRRLLMGTWVDISVADAGQPGVAAAVTAAFDTMDRLAALMSRFDPASTVSAINRAAGRQAVPIPAQLMTVLQEARVLAARTDGAFDITVGRLTRGPGGLPEGEIPDAPTIDEARRHIRIGHLKLDPRQHSARLDDAQTQIDLGGIAKLHILQAGLDTLQAGGIRGAMLNGGGDVLASARPDGRAWRIGIRDAAQPDRLLAVLPLHAGVVASSGDYERFVLRDGARYHHIINPATGRPTRGVHGVTLVAEHVGRVNGLGAATMVAGWQHGPALLARCGVQQALLIGDADRVWISPALAARLEPAPGQEHVRGLD